MTAVERLLTGHGRASGVTGVAIAILLVAVVVRVLGAVDPAVSRPSNIVHSGEVERREARCWDIPTTATDERIVEEMKQYRIQGIIGIRRKGATRRTRILYQ